MPLTLARIILRYRAFGQRTKTEMKPLQQQSFRTICRKPEVSGIPIPIFQDRTTIKIGAFADSRRFRPRCTKDLRKSKSAYADFRRPIHFRKNRNFP